MLQALREKMTGWVALLVIGLLIIPFAFFGIDQYFTGLRETWVAKVGDREIAPDALRQRIEDVRGQMRRLLGDAFDPRLFERPEFKREVLERLIEEEAVLIAAERAGVTIPADRLRREIVGIEVLQKDGRFDAERYQSLLRAHGLTAQSFEQRLRRELLLRDWVAQVAATALVPEAEVDRHLALRGQVRDFSWLALTPPEDETADEATLRAWYEAHPAKHREPERVVVEYVELAESSISVDTVPDEAELRRRYEEQKSRFVRPEQRRVAHILVTPKGADAEAERAALARAEELKGELERGTDFAELARTRSDDPGSRAAGGDLGWIERGHTDPAFEEAAFAAEVGAVVGPVRGASGYHLLKVLEVRPEEGKSFEEVREELAAEFLAGERERRFRELEDRLSDLVYRDPTSLEPVAEELGLEIRTLGPFAREGGEGLASHPEVIAHAFSEPVLIDGQTSEPFAVEPGRVLALRVREHQPARVRPFEEVREQVEREWRAERREQVARERAESLLTRLRQGASLDQLAAELGAELRREEGVGRFAATVDGRILAEAFRLPRPGAQPRLGLAALGDGRYALIAVTAARDADPAAASAEDRRAVREQLLAERAAADRLGFLEALKASVEIRIAEDRLAQL